MLSLSLSPPALGLPIHTFTHTVSHRAQDLDSSRGEKTRTKLHYSTVDVSAFHGNKKLR